MKRITALGMIVTCMALLAWAAPATAQDSEARTRVDQSPGWGVDETTGQVAIDPSLLVFYDPGTGTLVINPNEATAAAEELGAQIQKDGQWLLADGKTVRPIPGEKVFVVGDEPEGLVEESGLPAVELSQVRLSDPPKIPEEDPEARAAAPGPYPNTNPVRIRKWHRCTGCSGCLLGCFGSTWYNGYSSFKTCKFAIGFWNRCREEYVYTCYSYLMVNPGCTGGAIRLNFYANWICAPSC